MTKEKKSIIQVQGTEITILSLKEHDFISLTDMAKKFGGDDLIYSWMRNRNTLEFLGIWDKFTTLILKVANSRPLKKKRVSTTFEIDKLEEELIVVQK